MKNSKGKIKDDDIKIRVFFLKESVSIILSCKDLEGISVEEKTLADALEQLGKEIRKTFFKHLILNDNLIK